MSTKALFHRYLTGRWFRQRACIAVVLTLFLVVKTQADVFRWDNGQLIPGTEGITPGPGVQLDHRDLQLANLDSKDLAGANFEASNLTYAILGHSALTNANLRQSNLTNANFANSTLTNANLSGANLTNAHLYGSTLTDADLSGAMVTGAHFVFSHGFTKEQLYSTASYRQKNLQGIGLAGTDMTGWDFSGQSIQRTIFGSNFTKEQLYSTASYQQKDLQGIAVVSNNLTGWDLTGQDLTNANFGNSTLTDANFTGTIVAEANFSYADGFTKEQLYSTDSYKHKDLQGIGLEFNDLTGWDLTGQDLTNASFVYSTLANANLSGATVTGATFIATTLFGFTKEQLYSTASYQQKNLQGIILGGSFGAEPAPNDLSGWDFAAQNLTGADFLGATLTGADFSFADTRGALGLDATGVASLRNTILSDGRINGLNLASGETLLIRGYDGDTDSLPIPLRVQQELNIGPGGTLQPFFDEDVWNSTISFQSGIQVALGGTLELLFAPDTNVHSQVGRTFDLFDWTGVEPTGTFTVTSRYLWDLTSLYTTGEVRLTGTGGVADYDKSGLVDQGDLDLVLLNWGNEVLDPAAIGWTNDLPTGLVDQAELDKVLLNWGRQTAAGLPAASVPEPSTAALLAASGLAAWICGGRRRRAERD